MKILASSFALCAVLISGGAAQAALTPALGGQVINDTDLNITWLANANLAATNTFGLARNTDLGGGDYISNWGTMSWGAALKWIGAMNASNYLGYHDWRLPSTTPVNGSSFNYNVSNNGSTDYGMNISAPGTAYAGSTGSEMAHLFFDLGNKSYCDPVNSTAWTCAVIQIGWGLKNTGSFINLQPYNHWSGTEYSSSSAWYVDFSNSYQGNYYKATDKYDYVYAMAVRDGLVASVPLPAAAWLLGSGLLGLVGLSKRKATFQGESA